MRVLVAEDELDQLAFLKRLIASWGHDVLAAADGFEALERYSDFAPDVIVTDLKMPRVDGLELMDGVRTKGALPPTIVLTAYGNIDLALETVHAHGGFWYLEKPVNSGTLFALLRRAADYARLQAENKRLHQQLNHSGVLGELIGRSAPMQNVFAMIRQVAPTNASVLITGESGSGKELVARAIHSFSPRSTGAFVAINCAALPESLIESELFGHEKGAFTGASERRAGALELAEGGTLFLDEIGEMPASMQAKLLRFLEDLSFRRLGGTTELTANIRLVSATNRQPEAAVREGKMRSDLYYRLNVFRIEMPALRERMEDVPLIAAALIGKLNQVHGTRVTHLEEDAAIELQDHRWDGNVRELRNSIERAMILAGEGPLQRIHFKSVLRRRSDAAGSGCGGLQVEVGMSIADTERVLIEATLAHARNNKTRAATILGISAKTLHAKLRQYGPALVTPPDYKRAG